MPSYTMSVASCKRYSIEQSELIRRLRNSGMTKDQLSVAYDSFDMVDHYLAHNTKVFFDFLKQL